MQRMNAGSVLGRRAAWGRPAALPALAPRPAPAAAAARRPARAVVRAGKDKTTGNSALDGALSVGKGLVDSAAELVPASVPRPVAKGGVAIVGVMVVFWLVNKVLSTLLTIALLGGAAWLYFRSSSNSDSGGGGGGSGSGGGKSSDDPSDPLSEARRIMDKYR